MRTDRAVTRMTSDQVAMWRILDRQTLVKTLPSLAVGNHVLQILLRTQQSLHYVNRISNDPQFWLDSGFSRILLIEIKMQSSPLAGEHWFHYKGSWQQNILK